MVGKCLLLLVGKGKKRGKKVWGQHAEGKRTSRTVVVVQCR